MRLLLSAPVLAVFAVFSVLAFAPNDAYAAPKADLWPDWQAYDPDSTIRIDHAKWQAVLDRFVAEPEPGVTTFDYQAALDDRANGIDLVAGYVADMVLVQVSALNRAQQMAYWINLYNALTVKVVLDHYPVVSIRDIDISPGLFSLGLFSSGPWGKKLITVEGRTLSLDDIEHRILRPIWDDARIHYAVNCASVGCPALAKQAYDARQLEDQLDRAATGFINHPRAIHSDGDGGFVISSLYNWYREDFGARDAQFVAHLFTYAGAELTALLDGIGRFDVSDDVYDWALNAPKP
ncbi:MULTISPECIES: DUF547 domain-containing protein [Thalassospira]|uniref:DUF547 domain-containing protein n=2 Tax=Thalassospira TaxID=168934 RepID=A0A367W1I8_9PROT|nr:MULTISPECIES: DUF547 domain-containing protein [Thalassospira]MDG4721564.1 DUF547 domain-containing protein [Thalassospira sp. FZY0004]RCK31729.1 hypothetical protein TH19_20870 [Thalassospira profundimaris]